MAKERIGLDGGQWIEWEYNATSDDITIRRNVDSGSGEIILHNVGLRLTGVLANTGDLIITGDGTISGDLTVSTDAAVVGTLAVTGSIACGAVVNATAFQVAGAGAWTGTCLAANNLMVVSGIIMNTS